MVYNDVSGVTVSSSRGSTRIINALRRLYCCGSEMSSVTDWQPVRGSYHGPNKWLEGL